MLKFARYVRAANVDDALEVLRFRKGAQVMGGGIWMRLSDRTYPCVIDLSDCGLNTIEETDGEFRIGAYVTLRDLEVDERLNAATGNVLASAVHDIVGVQMRQLATVGGSVFGRFGFSDVICALLALDAEVELAEAGRIPLAQFVDMPYELDILTHVIVRKHDYRASYQCLRKAATDFATINACAAYWDGAWHVAVGSRPAKARLLTGDALGVASAEPTADELAHAIEAVRGLKYSSNLWGSERYRRHLAGVLAARAIVDAASYTSPEAADAARAVCAGEEAIA
ncbi:FAD binding domain-containing protein [Collinsella tanakaei]|uniref:FAD binding domain-containing protein n=1 Tax=Collinsella tanakaei TaxID=626935 RepID=UPI0025A36C77|nr:FAD binding domain-containing protein [Collinsella tanakaei]MDM8245243.1 FAD binding domain-containing protein [Collinsella tanakaei]